MDDREKLHRILSEVFDFFGYTVITDEKGYILKIDKNYAAFLGTTPEACRGKYVREIIPNSEVPRIIETPLPEVGNIFVLKDGTPIVNSRFPIFDDGKLIGVVSTTIFDDIKQSEQLHRQIKRLSRENQLYKEKYLALQGTANALQQIIGDAPALTAVKQTIAHVANSDLVVLITGETGVGKELFANAVHQLSRRYAEKFVKINCAAIPSELLESELFGYEGGAFSGASRAGKKGKFELADGGTLLLDEIGDMPLPLQSKLLRVLQEQEIEPVGSLRPKKIDVRILCSTNCDMERLVREGRFRRDLYYRINTVEVRVPPLRERRGDIPALCRYFIDSINRKEGIDITEVDAAAMELLKGYDWPGNVRELAHCIDRACVEKAFGELKSQDFAFKRALFGPGGEDGAQTPSVGELTRRAERQAILDALQACGGNRTRAAAMIRMSRAVFYRRLKEYGIG